MGGEKGFNSARGRVRGRRSLPRAEQRHQVIALAWLDGTAGWRIWLTLPAVGATLQRVMASSDELYSISSFAVERSTPSDGRCAKPAGSRRDAYGMPCDLPGEAAGGGPRCRADCRRALGRA
jgi:hypothetical protein